jgi:hypothetical protein
VIVESPIDYKCSKIGNSKGRRCEIGGEERIKNRESGRKYAFPAITAAYFTGSLKMVLNL